MINIGILIFPQVEELDFVGPFEVLNIVNKGPQKYTCVQLVAETSDPLCAFNGMKVIPDVTIRDCPPLDILVVPGGNGRLKAMENSVIKEFIQKQVLNAKYITSVCTGSLVLAAAGLLTNKKATTYHTAFNELAAYSVDVVKEKVVQDGQIITAAGVSSGLELGLYLLKQLFGEKIAREIAAKMEYNADPAIYK